MTRNLIGVDVDTGGNRVVRNAARASSTANYDIVAGNTVGPTVSAGTIAGSTNPHANYAF